RDFGKRCRQVGIADLVGPDVVAGWESGAAFPCGGKPDRFARRWNKFRFPRTCLREGLHMGDGTDWRRFEQLAMPHLDAAYNLALWLTRNADDAQDVVQEALLRAMRYIGGLRLESARPWLLQIVRHTCYSWLKENRPAERVLLDDPEDAWRDLAASSAGEPPALAIRKADREQINDAIAALPVPYR